MGDSLTTIGLAEDHFRGVNRSLSFLRKDERFCDLVFVCHSPNSIDATKPKKPKRVLAHAAVFQPHSALIKNLVEISRSKQLSDTIVISLDDVEELAVEKLVEYLYLGQTTINKVMEKNLQELVKRLGLDVTLDPSPNSDSSSENEVAETSVPVKKSPAKRGRKPGSGAKKGSRSPRKSHHEDDEDDEAKESDGEAEIEVLKTEAASKVSIVNLEPVDKTENKENEISNSQEAKEMYRKAVSNPLFTDVKDEAPKTDDSVNGVSKSDTSMVDIEEATKNDNSVNEDEAEAQDKVSDVPEAVDASTLDDVKSDVSKPDDVTSEISKPVDAKNDVSKKRRLTDNDKKLAPAKAPKKPRQEDDDDTSEADSEAVSARKKEIAAASLKFAETVTVTDSESDAPKMNKPGPKRKKPGPASKCDQTPNAVDENPSVSKEATKPNAARVYKDIGTAYTDESVMYCKFCGKIFVGNSAHAKHIAEFHSDEDAAKVVKSEAEDGAKKEDREKKPGPAGRKMGPASKQTTTSTPSRSTDSSKSSSHGKEKTEKKKDEVPAKKMMGPKSKSKPGPASSKQNDSPKGSDKKSSSSGAVRRNSSDDESDKRSDSKKKKSEPSSSSKKSSTSKTLHIFDTSSDEEDDRKTSKTPKSPPTTKKPKIRISLGGGAGGSGSASEKKQKGPKRQLLDDSVASTGGGSFRKCKLCPETFDKAANMKNHVLNHFKDKLYEQLPKCSPFLCPRCQAPSRDKVTLMRHYAFSHKVIYDFCSESDLAGERISGEGVEITHRSSSKSGSTTGSSSKKSSSKTSKSSKSDSKTSKSDSKTVSRAIVSSDSSDDESDFKAPKSSLNGSKREEAKASAADSDDDEVGDIFKMPTVHFSDSDSDTEVATKSATDAIKSFDDLFSDDDKKNE